MRKYEVYSAVVQRGKLYEVVVSCDPHASWFGVTVPAFVPSGAMLVDTLNAMPAYGSKFRGSVEVHGLPPGECIVEGLPLAVCAAVIGANLQANERVNEKQRLWYGSPFHAIPFATQGVVAVAAQATRAVYTCGAPNWLREHVNVQSVDGLTHLMSLYDAPPMRSPKFEDITGYTSENLDAIEEAVRGKEPLIFVGGYASAASLLCSVVQGLVPLPNASEMLSIVERHNLAGMKPPGGRPSRRVEHTAGDLQLWGTEAEPGIVPLADCGWVVAKDLGKLEPNTVRRLFEGARTLKAGQFETDYRLVTTYVPKSNGYGEAWLECCDFLESVRVFEGYRMTWCPSHVQDQEVTTTTDQMFKRIWGEW